MATLTRRKARQPLMVGQPLFSAGKYAEAPLHFTVVLRDDAAVFSLNLSLSEAERFAVYVARIATQKDFPALTDGRTSADCLRDMADTLDKMGRYDG